MHRSPLVWTISPVAASGNGHTGAIGTSRPGRNHRQLVRKGGLEPPRLAALEPKSRASTNSATFAMLTQGTIVAGPPIKRKPDRQRGLARKKPPDHSDGFQMVGCQGFEPWTYRLSVNCSTNRANSPETRGRIVHRKVTSNQAQNRGPTLIRKKPPDFSGGFLYGGLSRIRTLDLLIKSQLLYQLS